MSQQIPGALAIEHSLAALCEKSSALSGWIQHGPNLIESNLSISEDRIDYLTDVIDVVAQQYISVGRQMETLFFGFDQHFLIIVPEGNLRLGLLFPNKLKKYTECVPACQSFLLKNRPRLIANLATQLEKPRKSKSKPRSKPEPEPTS